MAFRLRQALQNEAQNKDFQRQGHKHLARRIFTLGLTIGTFALVIWGGGDLPTLLFLLILPVATASLFFGPTAGFGLSVLALAAAAIPTAMQINGPDGVNPQASGLSLILQLLPVAFGLGFLPLCLWRYRSSLQQDLNRSRQASAEIEVHREELDNLLLAEQENRERLQQAIQDSSSFLNQILNGDTAVRLDLRAVDPALAGLGRLLNRTADSLAEALEQTQQAVNELNSARRRYILQSWQQYMKAHRQYEYEVAQSDLDLQQSEFKALLAQAEKPSESSQKENGNSTLVAPIQIGGEVIGTLGLCRAPGEKPWSPEEQALVAAITERLALAAENLRLHEDAQRRAAQERLIAEVSARARETLDVDTVLKTTLRELGTSLDVAEVEVRLGLIPVGNGTRSNGTHVSEEY